MGDTANNKFILPDGFNYSCIPDCGLCCQGWEIHVEFKEYEILSKTDWNRISEKFKNRKIFTDSKDGRKYFELVDNKCIFLDTANYCIIHRQLGYDAKAHTCKRYPLNFVKTPDGIVLRLSFVCPSILHNTGERLDEQTDYIENIFRTSGDDYYSIIEPVYLDDETSLSWNEYLQVENALLKLLDSAGNYEDMLKAGAKFLRYVCSNKKNGLQIPDILKNSDQKSFFEKNPEPGITKRRLYLAVFATQGLLRQLSKIALNRYSTVIKIALGKGKIVINGTKTYLEKIDEVKFGINDRDISPAIKRYLRHLIFAKWHLMPASKLGPQNTNLISGYSLVLIIYALLKWYSKIFSSQRGGDKVELQDVEKAISSVEKYYAGHISRDAFFSDNKGFAQISNLLIMQKNLEDIII